MRSHTNTALITIVLVVATACAPRDPGAPASSNAWAGTITTEGDVTTVVNEAGSVWGGQATLVEELSIGVEAGADEYMFGGVADVWATDDRIYVLDSQVPVVRVFDAGGNHVMDIGRRGQGPGEFTEPAGLVVTDAGDILVVETSLQVDVFAPDGSSKATWNSGSPFSVYTNEMIVLGFDGQIWVPSIEREPFRFGRALLDGDGNAGETLFPPELGWEPPCLTYTRRGNDSTYCGIPFEPSAASALLLDGAWAVGVSNEYAYEVHNLDGTRLHVQRYWEPVPVTAEEADYAKQRTAQLVRERMGAGPDWTWNGPEIPSHKPAFDLLSPDRDGRLWVLRARASHLSTDCSEDEAECWRPEGYWLDAFERDGHFLGGVTLARRPAGRLFIDGTTIIAAEMDEAGTYVVKKYRLVLPGDDGS